MRLARMVGAAAAGIAGFWVAKQVLRSMRMYDFGGRVVLVVGGSRGLGLVMARQLGQAGARLAIVARDSVELQKAERELRMLGHEVVAYSCDITQKDEVDKTVEAIRNHFGQIDVLINDAGIIEVGPIDTMTEDDFKESMDIHFWGPLHFAMAVIPEMKARKSGRIVNISSIGGKISVPHLLPYCASKFALVGLSEGMRSELLKDGVVVTTVCPGMMRTGSHVNAYFKGHNRAEYAWFSLGNALPFFSVSAEQAAKQVLQACRRGDPELIISLPAQLATKMVGLFPGLIEDMFAAVDMVMPPPNGHGAAKFTGRESRSWISPSFFTKLSDDASYRNNEMRG